MAETETQKDIASTLATLASRQGEQSSSRKLTGPERAAVLMLALGEQHGSKVWGLLDDDELRELSIIMSTLGTVEAPVIENLLLEFVSRISVSGALMGNYDATERLLQQYLPPERVGGIMEDDMGLLGPVRLRDVDESQAQLVNLAKDLAAKGEIMIAKSHGDEELIY